eukprot:1855959-Ditylum_brightwellii.AAC.1
MQKIALAWSSCGPSQEVMYGYLQLHPHIPPQQELASFVKVIGKKYKILAEKKFYYDTVDGLKLYPQEASKVKIQDGSTMDGNMTIM